MYELATPESRAWGYLVAVQFLSYWLVTHNLSQGVFYTHPVPCTVVFLALRALAELAARRFLSLPPAGLPSAIRKDVRYASIAVWFIAEFAAYPFGFGALRALLPRDASQACYRVHLIATRVAPFVLATTSYNARQHLARRYAVFLSALICTFPLSASFGTPGAVIGALAGGAAGALATASLRARMDIIEPLRLPGPPEPLTSAGAVVVLSATGVWNAQYRLATAPPLRDALRETLKSVRGWRFQHPQDQQHLETAEMGDGDIVKSSDTVDADLVDGKRDDGGRI